MSVAWLSPRVWPTVAAEASRYWLRRHRTIILGVALLTVIVGLRALTADSKGEIIIGWVASVGPFVAGFLTMSGIVADERESGVILLWFQKPGSLVRLYALRYALYQLLLSSFVLLLGIVIATFAVAGGVFTPSKAVRLAVAMLPLALVPAAMVFAFSAWGARRDSVLAFAAILLPVTFAATLGLNHTAFARVIKAIVFPVDPIAAIAGSPAYDPSITKPVLIVLAHLMAWTAIALIGLQNMQRRLQLDG